MMFKLLDFMQSVTIMPHEFYTGITTRFTASPVCAPALLAQQDHKTTGRPAATLRNASKTPAV